LTQFSLRQLLLIFPVVGALVGCGGESSSPLSNWTGKTFLLDTPAIAKSKWVRPKGFGSEFGGYVPQFLFAVESGAGDSVSVTMTTARKGVQDMCTPTTEAKVDSAAYPSIQFGASAFPILVVNDDAEHPGKARTTTHNVAFKDVLPGPPDATNSQFDATLDIAELYTMFWQITDATKDKVCETFDYNGVPCEACPDNGEKYCLTVRAVQLMATPATTPLKKLSASDIATSCP
jgi:hypothetical protein